MTATADPRSRGRSRTRTSRAGGGGGAAVDDGSRPAAYWLLLALVGVLTLIGLVMVLSASSVQGVRDHGSSWAYFHRQLLWVALGGVALAVTLRVDYRFWRRFAPAGLVVSIGLLLLVLVPQVGVTVNGSSRWLGAGTFRLQPAEIAKLALVLFCADLLARRASRMRDGRATLRPVVFVGGAVSALLMLQPDMGTTLVTGAIVFSVLFVAGAPLHRLTVLALVGSAGATVLAFSEGYRRARLLAFVNPEADPSNTGYQTIQSLVGIASGGIGGVGLGASRAKWGFLPNAHTDFIFAIIGEELGLIGGLLVVALFAGFGVLGVRTAARAPDRFGALLATGITTWVLVQAFVNIGAVVGILPITGVPLPFVSFGGSSLIVLMAATGLLLNVARQGRPQRAAPAPASS